jgi:hypothetical protein
MHRHNTEMSSAEVTTCCASTQTWLAGASPKTLPLVVPRLLMLVAESEDDEREALARCTSPLNSQVKYKSARAWTRFLVDSSCFRLAEF